MIKADTGTIKITPFLSQAAAQVAPKHMDQSVEVDKSLVEAARGGDRAAFGSLYERYGGMVHGILLARTPRTEVEDLVQDVFMTAWKKIHTLRETSAFGGWLGMIARNRAMDFYRQREINDELTDEIAGTLVAERPPVSEARAALDAIRSLSEAYRETLIMRLVEGMSGPEIAARTGMTPESVRVNLHRGMKLLREKLSPRDGNQAGVGYER